MFLIGGVALAVIIWVSNRCLNRARHEAELDIAQVRNNVPNHEEPVVLHMDLQVVRKIGTFSKEDEVRQAERT